MDNLTPPPTSGWVKLRAWLAVIIYFLAIFFTLPYFPIARDWIYENYGKAAFSIGVAAILGLTLLGVLYYFIRVKHERREVVYAWLVAIVFVYILVLSHMRLPVEKVHFIEYGLLSWLVFVALRHHTHSALIYLQGGLAVFMLGAIDEFIQWWLPNRTGDLRDVWFNGLAGLLPQLMIALVGRPQSILPKVDLRAYRTVMALAVLALVLLGLFLQVVSGFGYKIKDREIGVFISVYTPDELEHKNQMFQDQASGSPEDLIPRTIRDDPFFSEAQVHQFRRDRYYYRHENPMVAYKENLILTKYYSAYAAYKGLEWDEEWLATLNERNFAAFTEYRELNWSTDKTNECTEQLGARIAESYSSPVSAGLITSFTSSTMWIVIALLSILLVFSTWRFSKRNSFSKDKP